MVYFGTYENPSAFVKAYYADEVGKVMQTIVRRLTTARIEYA